MSLSRNKKANRAKRGRLPDAVVACIGGGSNAIGMFHPFVDDESVALYGVEAKQEVVLKLGSMSRPSQVDN